MFRWFVIITLLLPLNSYAKLTDYSVTGEIFEGYYLSAGKNAPLIVLVHNWDGLTDFAELAQQLESAGIQHEMITYLIL